MKGEKHKTDTEKESQVNKIGKLHYLNFVQAWGTGKHWARDCHLITEENIAELKGMSNLNIAEEEDSVEGIKFLYKVTK